METSLTVRDMASAPHPEDIKAALRKRFGSLVAFEKAHYLPKNSARDVLRGKAVRRTADAIAAALETSVQDLFPGRFLSTKRDDSTAEAMSHYPKRKPV